ncbi:MAG: hypothetical protein KDC92_17550, partial [Bacteroidetes bacterium]|nr:hypothetical protein [Bacteroidota bacterium]
MYKALLLLLALFSIPKMVIGQEIIVELIEVEGNYRTKHGFITKIIPVKAGDTLTVLEQHFLEGVCQRALINTKLFNSVEVSFVTSSSQTKLHIEVKERWYLYPSPHLALADRNFNEWWVDRNHDFTRLVVGGTLLHKNISGHGDELLATVWTGFERRAIIDYKTPYLHH